MFRLKKERKRTILKNICHDHKVWSNKTGIVRFHEFSGFNKGDVLICDGYYILLEKRQITMSDQFFPPGVNCWSYMLLISGYMSSHEKANVKEDGLFEGKEFYKV